MIESALIVLYLSFINPADPTGKTIYPSCVGDMEYNYFNNLPNTKYPNLVLSMPVYDTNKNVVDPSIYEIAYSKDERSLFLIQGGIIMAKLPVDTIFTLDKEYKLPTADVQVVGPHKVLIIYREGSIETNSMLDTP